MNNLVDFLTARLDEREAALRQLAEARAGDAVPEITRGAMLIIEAAPDWREAEAFREVLADIEAKRRIAAAYVEMRDSDDHGEMRLIGYEEGLKAAVEMLAQVHRDHPDFDPAWGSDG